MVVPPGIRGADLVAPGKMVWVVDENLRFEDQPDGSKRFVVTAAAVLDDMFP